MTPEDLKQHLTEITKRLHHYKGDVDEAKGLYDSARNDAFEVMSEHEMDGFVSPDGDGTISMVRSSTLVLDEAGLLADLDPDQARAVTETVVNQAKLEAAVELGQIPAALVAKHTSEKAKKPYVRYVR